MSATKHVHAHPSRFHASPHPAAAVFSIVIDDVDASKVVEDDLHRLLTDTSLDVRYNKEECDAKIRRMRTEAEKRKSEFARLLEEHAQVIRRLKQIEQDSVIMKA
ncbi:uncharacterized protein LOC113469607 [Diaphorina citri]|uniref:Uncharacterized protein LOC113469607 n=1 Tax=Diaphorina citri TaxID=121845 RepID=A0A3Q0J963_DIACI|nr:uncharacterized protein LOC113469607 [Diaphorina citri]XP_026683253.1 uncharacterized protein LOC113469607 [Diaphorina citri]XP_026683254.1 uncharacterized protein LOC113469607 [Diaphorina citri]XP_026683255.1 uncharacterized protein LOC113469607 [Diaphorina citri]KAI5706388.1 hypothetical protein M8J75_007641 [Diaphorina citri]KAI5741794.1 hypothetical protein M8J76_017121 [Diaphorina citri]KAI5747249.1 hypothetical protein M8J77_012697 [Diaphorina citri]